MDASGSTPFKRMTRAEAEACGRDHPVLSPWRVVAAQVALGAVAVAWRDSSAGASARVSAAYGAAVVVFRAR